MNIYYDIQTLPAFNNAVITIGTFDGLHNGHRKIIALMLQEAEKIGGETIIITFDPHPRQIIGKENNPVFLINSLAEKIILLQNSGIDHLVVIPFTEAFANQSAEDYIKDFLVNTFKPHTIIIGYDHHFGKGRSGNYKLLEEKATKYNFVVKEIPVHMLQDVTISSTKIREALLHGDIATARNFLGYDYFFTGKVITGNMLGRMIGYPTANIEMEEIQKLVPGNGVYAVLVKINSLEKKEYFGMMNIGIRPTIDGTIRVIEVNIFDFDEDIYGKLITVTLKKHLRNEIKFNGLDALKEQLAKDKLDAMEALS